MCNFLWIDKCFLVVLRDGRHSSGTSYWFEISLRLFRCFYEFLMCSSFVCLATQTINVLVLKCLNYLFIILIKYDVWKLLLLNILYNKI